MGAFPQVDPIPLPAPILFFKTLHIIMLTLHFYMVHLLLAGSLIAAVLALRTRLKNSLMMSDASRLIIKKLPVVTAFVINFAIPPLLFTQVLYGRALFPASVIVGVWWFSIVLLVLLVYYLLYISQKRSETGKTWWWISLAGFLIAVIVAFLYSNTMTLMLRPEAWLEMYRANPTGLQLPSGDPTIIPRWIYMLTASLTVGACGLPMLSLKTSIENKTAVFLKKLGGGITLLFSIPLFIAGYWVFSTQPEIVKERLLSSGFYKAFIYLWSAALFLLIASSLLMVLRTSLKSRIPVFIAASAGLLNIASWVTIRDGIRDYTILQKGLDVWSRRISVNWSVVLFFLALFVVALAVTSWMLSQVIGSNKVKERYGLSKK